MKNGILGLLNNSDDGVTATCRAIVPKRARQRILELAHSSAKGGHFGFQKTKQAQTTFPLESHDTRRPRLV